MTLYSASGQLTPTPPFDFSQSLKFLGQFRPTQGEQTFAELSLTKAVFVNGQLIVFTVRSSGTSEQPQLDYALHSATPIRVETRAAAEDRMAFFLSLGDDLRPFYALAEHDAPLAPVLKQLYGLHQVKFLTPFENACWAVLTQRNPIAMASKMKHALINTYGQSLTLEAGTYAAFPEPGMLSTDLGELTNVIGNKQKADYLSAVISAFRRMDEGWLRDAPYPEVEAWLRGIRGIGAWSAAFVLLRGLGHMDHMPLAEARLADVMTKVYNRDNRLTKPQLQAIADSYGQWQGYWAYYLRAGG